MVPTCRTSVLSALVAELIEQFIFTRIFPSFFVIVIEKLNQAKKMLILGYNFGHLKSYSKIPTLQHSTVIDSLCNSDQNSLNFDCHAVLRFCPFKHFRPVIFEIQTYSHFPTKPRMTAVATKMIGNPTISM